jgi:hypothetical protein
MEKPATWRKLLERYSSNGQERRRIATALGVQPITLIRWASGESTPRPQNLRALLTVLPEEPEYLLHLIEQEFPNFSINLETNPADAEPMEIPSAFYAQAFRTSNSIPKGLRAWSICDLILQQVLKQLDPHRLGMAALITRCMPPSFEGKVRSLREVQGRGIPPWRENLEQQGVLRGSESLSGYAVTNMHLVVKQDLRKQTSLLPSVHSGFGASAAAAPIIRSNEIAGCFLVVSTQLEYFVPARSQLVAYYADVLSLAFESEDFYPPEKIFLGFLPPTEEQLLLLSEFRQRFTEMLTRATRNQEPMSPAQAEQHIWRELEEELLRHLVNEKT